MKIPQNESFLTLLITIDLDRQLRKIAAEKRTNRSNVVREILQEYVNSHPIEDINSQPVAG
jgi:hypothetical protein